jgi:hypothetical protein
MSETSEPHQGNKALTLFSAKVSPLTMGDLDFIAARDDIENRGENEISSDLLPGSRLSVAGRRRGHDRYRELSA